MKKGRQNCSMQHRFPVVFSHVAAWASLLRRSALPCWLAPLLAPLCDRQQRLDAGEQRCAHCIAAAQQRNPLGSVARWPGVCRGCAATALAALLGNPAIRYCTSAASQFQKACSSSLSRDRPVSASSHHAPSSRCIPYSILRWKLSDFSPFAVVMARQAPLHSP